MRVLIDACIDPRVAQILTGHEVTTAFDLGWQRLRDHILLSKASGHFDVFVTTDRGFEYEHNLIKLQIAVVIVHVPRKKLEQYRPLISKLQDALRSAAPGQVLHVPEKTDGS